MVALASCCSNHSGSHGVGRIPARDLSSSWVRTDVQVGTSNNPHFSTIEGIVYPSQHHIYRGNGLRDCATMSCKFVL